MIREASIADVPELVKLFDAYRVWYRKCSDITTAEKFLTNRLTNKESIVFLAEEDNKAIGFTQLYPIFSSVRMHKMWLLNDLYVDEAYRGRGHSKRLISAAKNLCKKTTACGILLETETSNEIGNRLYPSEGFHLESNNFYFWTNKN